MYRQYIGTNFATKDKFGFNLLIYRKLHWTEFNFLLLRGIIVTNCFEITCKLNYKTLAPTLVTAKPTACIYLHHRHTSFSIPDSPFSFPLNCVDSSLSSSITPSLFHSLNLPVSHILPTVDSLLPSRVQTTSTSPRTIVLTISSHQLSFVYQLFPFIVLC